MTSANLQRHVSTQIHQKYVVRFDADLLSYHNDTAKFTLKCCRMQRVG